MSAKNPRINITIEQSTAGLLANLAEQEHKSVSSLVKELMLEALERREDRALSAISTARDKPKIKRVKHAIAWK